MTSTIYSENSQHDQALIPYVGRLQLDQAPFTADSSGEFFYSDPEIQQNLNLLKHLTQSSNLIPVVLSPKDGGKSSLLRAFIEESGNTSKICTIDANHSNDKAYILKEIAKCFGMDSDANEPDLLHLLHKKATALYQESKYPVIAIENAQHLQDDACRLLLSLQQGLEDKINTWHVLFFADCITGEPPKLYNIDLSRYPQLHILLLEPYTLEQTKSYISHRLSAAGYIGDCPLTDDAINYIHLNSKGLPGRINELTHSALLKLSTQDPGAYSGLTPGIQSGLNQNRLSFRTLFTGFLILLGTGTILYFQEDINAIFSLSAKDKGPVAIKATDSNKPEIKSNKKGLTGQVTSSADSKNPAESPPEGDLPANIETKNTAPQTDSIKQEANASTEKNIEQANESSYKKILALLPNTVHREDWLLQQKGKYSVRLLGTFKEKIITNYLNESISGKKFDHEISYYLTKKDNQFKHTLLYGIFPSYLSAKVAILNLPKNMKSNGPWPVKLEDIKKNIDDYRESIPVKTKEPALNNPPESEPHEIATANALDNTPSNAPTNAPAITQSNAIPIDKTISKNDTPQTIHGGTNASLKDQDSDSFTVQLLSTSSKKPLISYMEKYKLEDKSVLYKTTRNGKDWYVLFYGVFETREMAESFIANLPKSAREGGPWIRKMGDLQKGFR